MNMENRRIFISYKRANKNLVFPLVKKIEEQLCLKCWIDLDGIESSSQFASVICKAIDNSEIVLFMHSSLHQTVDFDEDWTIKELNYARAKKKRVVLVKLDSSELDNIFLMEYGTKNNIDSNDSIQLEKLITDLRKWLDLPISEPANIQKQNTLQTQMSNHSGAEIHVTADIDCDMFRFNELLCSLKADQEQVIYLVPGNHRLRFVSSIFPDIDFIIKKYNVPNESYSDIIDVELKGKIESKTKGISKYEGKTEDLDRTSNCIRGTHSEGKKAVSFDPEKPIFNIATLGHVNHGKTTLTNAICSVASSREFASHFVEESKKVFSSNLKINYSESEYETEERHYIHIDCYNHSDYIKGLITDFNVDGAIVVVSATDGPMPQTREHILLARQLNIPRLIVFLNKCDLVDEKEMLELVEFEMREMLEQYEFEDDTPFIYGSALGAVNGITKWKKKIDELLNACDEWFDDPVQTIDKPFLMPIEDVFDMEGRETAVTGRIEKGIIRSENEVQILGLGYEQWSVVKGIEMFRKIVSEGQAGDNVGLLLSDVDTNEIERGMVVCSPYGYQQAKSFRAVIYILKEEEGGRATPFGNHYRPQFYFRTMDCTGEISLPKGVEMVMPGDNAEIDVELICSVVFNLGLHFNVYDGKRKVAMGVITNVI